MRVAQLEVVFNHPNDRISQICLSSLPKSYDRPVDARGEVHGGPHGSDSMELLRLEVTKGRHKVFDLAGRRCFAGFEVALDA